MLPYEIEPRALSNLIEDREKAPLVLLDVREPWEVETAPFYGSVSMPMGDIPSRIHAEIDPDAHIVTICHHGVRSLNVAAWLRSQGFEQAQSMAGGTEAWAAQVDPSMTRY